MTKCLLCGKNKKLCEAHIFPKWCFKALYPNNKIEGKSLVMISDSQNYTKRKRDGIKDSNILCGDCDSKILGELDDYAKGIIIDISPKLIKEVDNSKILFFENINSNKFKLFFLSILWRMAISRLEEFRNISLPDKFIAELKSRIINQDGGNIDDFSVLITKYDSYKNKKVVEKYVASPHKERIEGLNYIVFYFPNGYIATVKVDRRKQLDSLAKLSISDKNVFVLQWEFFEDSINFELLKRNLHKI